MVKYCQQSFDTLFLWEFNFMNGDYFVFLFSKNKLLNWSGLVFLHLTVKLLIFYLRTLQCDQENHEHLKYLRNIYCVMTNHSKDQDM